jgi:hypothetical protein
VDISFKDDVTVILLIDFSLLCAHPFPFALRKSFSLCIYKDDVTVILLLNVFLMRALPFPSLSWGVFPSVFKDDVTVILLLDAPLSLPYHGEYFPLYLKTT